MARTGIDGAFRWGLSRIKRDSGRWDPITGRLNKRRRKGAAEGEQEEGL